MERMIESRIGIVVFQWVVAETEVIVLILIVQHFLLESVAYDLCLLFHRIFRYWQLNILHSNCFLHCYHSICNNSKRSGS